mgnify:CR=1 FL=1
MKCDAGYFIFSRLLLPPEPRIKLIHTPCPGVLQSGLQPCLCDLFHFGRIGKKRSDNIRQFFFPCQRKEASLFAVPQDPIQIRIGIGQADRTI